MFITDSVQLNTHCIIHKNFLIRNNYHLHKSDKDEHDLGLYGFIMKIVVDINNSIRIEINPLSPYQSFFLESLDGN